MQEPYLQMPNFNKQFILTTDGSFQGIGGCVSQRYDDGLRPVAYFSRSLKASENNYGAFDIELMAVIDCIKHFTVYLVGKPFLILTDCKSLVPVLTKRKATTKRAQKWLQELLGYNFDTRHFPGTQNIIADSLSRYPIPYEGEDETKEIIMTLQTDHCANHTRSIFCDMQFTTYVADDMTQEIEMTVIQPLSYQCARVLIDTNLCDSICNNQPIIFDTKTLQQTCNVNDKKPRHDTMQDSSTWYDMWSSPTCFWNNNTEQLHNDTIDTTMTTKTTDMLTSTHDMSLGRGDTGMLPPIGTKRHAQVEQVKNHYCYEFPYYMDDAPIQIHPEYVDVFIHYQDALESSPFYKETMLMSSDDVTGENLYVSPLKTAQIVASIYKQIDCDIYRHDTPWYPVAMVETIMTRSRAQAATRHGEKLRKEELKLLQDLPTVQKHMIAPELFHEDGTLIDHDKMQDSEILYADYVDMQGAVQNDDKVPETIEIDSDK